MISEDNPFRPHLIAIGREDLSYRRRTPSESFYQRIRRYWFLNEVLRFAVVGILALLAWAATIIAACWVWSLFHKGPVL